MSWNLFRRWDVRRMGDQIFHCDMDRMLFLFWIFQL